MKIEGGPLNTRNTDPFKPRTDERVALQLQGGWGKSSNQRKRAGVCA